jgi:hypothetical protein
VQHLVVRVEHDDRPRRDALQGPARDVNAVLRLEVPASQGGQRDHVVDAFHAAEAARGKRQVGGNDKHNRIRQRARLLVEELRGFGAHRRIEARHDVEHLALAGKILEPQVLEILRSQAELGRSVALRKVAATLMGLPLSVTPPCSLPLPRMPGLIRGLQYARAPSARNNVIRTARRRGAGASTDQPQHRRRPC